MGKFFLSVLLLLAVCIQFALSSDLPTIDPKDIPIWPAGDIVDIIYLQAPLFKKQHGDTLQKFHLFHAGMAFWNVRTNETWSLEFDALPDFFTSLFPEFVVQNGTKIIKWHNTAGVLQFGSTDWKYWTSKQHKIGIMSGAIHNNFRQWMIDSANKTASFYGLLSIYENWSEKVEARKMIIPGFTCFDFVYVACDVLHKMGAKFRPLSELPEIPKRDFINLYAKEKPLEVSIYDPKHHDKIIEFYELLNKKFKELSFTEFLAEMFRLLIGHVYLYREGKYYYINLQFPIGFNWHYSYQPLYPGYN